MTDVVRRSLLASCALSLLLLPLALFALHSRPAAYFAPEGHPPGQAAYVMMRPAGHLAFCGAFLQILLASFGPGIARFARMGSLVPVHRALGISVLAFALAHPLLFAWARVRRAGAPQFLKTFLPNPAENYWELHLFFGALALLGLALSAAAALLARRLGDRLWRAVHALNYGVFGLAFYHSYFIGGETRHLPLSIVYPAMAAAVLLLLAGRFTGLLRH